ncbi:nuclear transport factor 2 family protein [Streptomyces sp. NPDC002346]
MFSTVSAPRLLGPDRRVSAAAGKRVALALFTGVAVDHDFTAYDRYAAECYCQHTPTMPNGTADAKEFFAPIITNYPDFSVSAKRIVAEGDYVTIHSHFKMTVEDPGLAIVGLLRVRGGKVVEHWDVVQPVPATSANGNTMF